MDIRKTTDTILNDYLSATGRTQKSVITAGEYLAFRNQAILECERGIREEGSSSIGDTPSLLEKAAPTAKKAVETQKERQKAEQKEKITEIRPTEEKKSRAEIRMALMKGVNG